MDRPALLARALWLSRLSVAFGLASGAVSIGSGIAEHSLGVLAAGLSVMADVTGSVVLIWRFRVERTDPERAEHVEQRAAYAVATALGIIGLALAVDSIRELIAASHPGSSALTIIVSAVSFCVLLPLAGAKRRTAVALSSHALKGDSTLSAIGASTAILALIGLVLFKAFGWWWTDRAVALLIAGVAAVEARTLLVAEEAGD